MISTSTVTFSAEGSLALALHDVRFVQVMHNERTPLVSVVLAGAAGSGKTALAAKLGMESGFPFVKRVSGENMLNLTELGKAEVITKVRLWTARVQRVCSSVAC
jgi:DNA helicase TIP49 (TBP-interacting protein)